MPTLPRSLPSGPTQAGQGAFGRVPTVPDPFATQASTISGNMGNLSSLYGLQNQFNTNAAQQGALPFQLNLPMYQQNIGAEAQNRTNQLAGNVTDSTKNQLLQGAAQRGISSGQVLGDSPSANAAYLAALGHTSEGQQALGAQNLRADIATTPIGQQLNAASFMPDWMQGQEAQNWANMFGAAPNPGMANQAGLNAFRGGYGSVGGMGGGGGGPTDLLGFPQGNMSGSQDFGPGANAFWGRGAAGAAAPPGSSVAHSGGDFGASQAPYGTSTSPYTGQSVAPWASGGAQFPGSFGGGGAGVDQGMPSPGNWGNFYAGGAAGGPAAGMGGGNTFMGTPYGPPNSFQPGDFEAMFGDLGG